MRINDYPEKTTIDHEDKLVVDSISGTRSMSVDTVINEANDSLKKDDILQKIGPFENFEAYNPTISSAPIFLAQRQSYGLDQEADENTYKIPIPILYFEMLNHLPLEERLNHYGGRELGQDVVSEAHKQAIKDGTFYDIYIGDYWIFDGVKYYVADINYWDTQSLNSVIPPHLLLVPGDGIYNMSMYELTEGVSFTGYVGCKWRTSTERTNLKNAMESYFGSNMTFDHMEFLPTNLTSQTLTLDGDSCTEILETTSALNTNFDLLTEQMVFGCKISGYKTSDTNALKQLRLFKCKSMFTTTYGEGGYWLRDLGHSSDRKTFLVVNNTEVGCLVSSEDGVTDSFGIRPVITIGYNPSSPEEGDQSEL